MQDRPICLSCSEVVEYDPVFEAPCGHPGCPSAVFHGICLMQWREWRQEFIQQMRRRFQQMFDDHQGHFDPEDN